MIRFYNARILTMEENCPIFEGELWTRADKVYFVGTAQEAKQKQQEEQPLFDREMDCKGNLIMPGFKNAHTHSSMTFLRSFADDYSLQDWLYQKVFPYEDKLRPEDVGPLSKVAILEYLSGGITANFDMYMFMKDMAQTSIDMGFRTVYCGSVNDFSGSPEAIDVRTRDEYQTLNHMSPLISYQIGFHAEYTTGMERLERIAQIAKDFQAPVYTHMAETKAETDGCIERYGKTPARLLSDMGMFEYGGGGFHCVWFSEEDMDIFSEKKLHIVTNPASNCKLASGVAPILKFLEKGINVAIGTDGPASNNALDMFREMYLINALQKLSVMDASAMDANRTLFMATVGGAKAMGLTNSDVLSVGKQADLILIDLSMPNMQPIHNITKNLVYSGSKSNIKLTMIAGKILYENGQYFVGQAAEDIYQEADEITRRIIRETEG